MWGVMRWELRLLGCREITKGKKVFGSGNKWDDYNAISAMETLLAYQLLYENLMKWSDWMKPTPTHGTDWSSITADSCRSCYEGLLQLNHFDFVHPHGDWRSDEHPSKNTAHSPPVNFCNDSFDNASLSGLRWEEWHNQLIIQFNSQLHAHMLNIHESVKQVHKYVYVYSNASHVVKWITKHSISTYRIRIFIQFSKTDCIFASTYWKLEYSEMNEEMKRKNEMKSGWK